MSSLLSLLWCICLFVAIGVTWASKPEDIPTEDDVAEMMVQAMMSTLEELEHDGPSMLPNLMVYILGQHTDRYFPLGLLNEPMTENIFNQHLDTAKGFTVVNFDYRANDEDEFVDIAATPILGPSTINFVSRLIYYFAGIIAWDQHGLVKKNLTRISWFNEGHQCLTFRFLNPKFRDEYVKIISHDVGQEWFTGFVQEANVPKRVFDNHEIMEDLSYDQGIWEYYYKGEPICQPFVGLTQASELALYLKETYVIPLLSLFQKGHHKEDLHRISYTINNHLKKDQAFFVAQFARYNLAYISQSLMKGARTMSQFVGMDFVGSTPTKVVTNFYFLDHVDPEDVIFEIRQLFFKVGLKFKYDIPDSLYAFRPAMFSVGEKSEMIAKPVQYGSFVSGYLNSLPSVSANILKRPIVLDFHFVDPAKTSSYGLLVAKVTFKLDQNESCLQCFPMIYETLGNMDMAQMENLDLKEIRIVPLKSDELTLYVSIIRAAEEANRQIALIQDVLTLLLRSVGIHNEVFIGTMGDMTKKFNLIKGVSTLSKEIREDSAIEFKVETRAGREAIQREAGQKKLELFKKEEDKKKKPSVPQPAQKSIRQLVKEAAHRDKKGSRAAKTTVEPVPETKEVKKVEIETKASKDEKAKEEEVLKTPEPVPVTVKTAKVKASKRRRQEMLQSGQLKCKTPVTTGTTTSTTETVQQEPSLPVQIEPAVAKTSPQAPRKDIGTVSTVKRARGQNGPKKESTTSNTQPSVVGSESIRQGFHPKDQNSSTDSSSWPILGPIVAKCNHILGPANVQEQVQCKGEEKAEVVQVEPVAKPTPNDEADSAVVKSTSSKPASVPFKEACLSASAAEFVPSSIKTEGSLNGSISPEFYRSPLVIVSSAGKPLSQGHHVGIWTSYTGFNMWSNPAWTRFQAVHIIRRVLSPTLPSERYASLLFNVNDEDAGLCLIQVVNWITLRADPYVKRRTVAVSLVGSAHSICSSATAIVFTILFPDETDVSAYKDAMSGYTSHATFMNKALCPLAEVFIKETINPASRKESWYLARQFQHGNLVYSQFSSLCAAGSWLKHLDSSVVSGMFFLTRMDPPKAVKCLECKHQIMIESVNVHALYEVMLSMMETLVEDSWTGSYCKYSFLPYANHIQFKIPDNCAFSSELIIQLDPDTPEKILTEGKKLSQHISSALRQFRILSLQGTSYLIPFYPLNSKLCKAARWLYNSNMHAFNTREVLTKTAMTIRFLEPQAAPCDLERWFIIQHLVRPDNLETLERLLNELFSLPRHAGLAEPRAFWHRKLNDNHYIVGVAFLEQPFEDLLCALVNALCIYAGFNPYDISEAFKETSISLLHEWQVNRLVEVAMAAYIIPETESVLEKKVISEEPETESVQQVLACHTGEAKALVISEKDLLNIATEIPSSPPVRRVMSKAYIPVIPSLTFSATPNFSHSRTHWQFRYQVDNSTPIDRLKLCIPKRCNGQFYAYLNALTEQLPEDYWKKGYGLMVERLYTDHRVYEVLGDELDVVFDLEVTGRSRSGDVLLVLIKLLSAIVTHSVPVDKIVFMSLKDASNAEIRIVALPTITVGQLALLKREAGTSIAWIQR